MLPLILMIMLSAAPSDKDANAAAMYIQSYVTPALLGVCKVSSPEMAAEFDAALARWQETNKIAVARGEVVLREQAKLEGTDLDKFNFEQRKSMVERLKAMPVSELVAGTLFDKTLSIFFNFIGLALMYCTTLLIEGDIVMLVGGNMVPADVKLIRGDTMSIDTAAMTMPNKASSISSAFG